MKKYIASAVIIFFIVIVIIAYRGRQSKLDVVSTVPPVASNPQSLRGAQTLEAFRDGEYVGKNADAIFGNLRVRAVIRGQRLADVVFEDYPKDKRHSFEISKNSMPVLTREAIAAQSESVDNISGATQTVDAFKESLKFALAQARS